jgi:hypothetical protein
MIPVESALSLWPARTTNRRGETSPAPALLLPHFSIAIPPVMHRFGGGGASFRAPPIDPPAQCLSKASPRSPLVNRRRLFFPGVSSKLPPSVGLLGAVALPPRPPCPPQVETQHDAHKVLGEISERYVSGPTALFFPR